MRLTDLFLSFKIALFWAFSSFFMLFSGFVPDFFLACSGPALYHILILRPMAHLEECRE